MAFLTLNSIPVQVVPGTGVRRAAHLGQYARSYNGTPYSTVRATKVEVACTTTPMSEADALITEYLIAGRGHVWSFDGTDTSSRGTPVLSSGGAGYEISVDDQKFGTHSLKVLGTDGFVRWSLAGDTAFSLTAWTMMFWTLEGPDWHHYARTSVGSYWKDGAAIAAGSFPSWATFSSLILRLDANGADTFVDDLVLLPYVAPSTWPALVHGGSAFGPLPKHAVGGSWLSSHCSEALCRWESTEPVNGWGGDVGAVVNFELLGE